MSISTRLAHSCGERKTAMALMKSIRKRLLEAAEYASAASTYSASATAAELTTAQTVVLALFYGLLFGDVAFCESVLRLQVEQLRSTFLRVWLADDFQFSRHDVAMVMSMLSYLLETGRLLVPDHIVNIFANLVQKYDVADCCSVGLLQLFAMGRPNETCDKVTSSFKRPFQGFGMMNLSWLTGKKEVPQEANRNDLPEEQFVVVEMTSDPKTSEAPDVTGAGKCSVTESEGVDSQRAESTSAVTDESGSGTGCSDSFGEESIPGVPLSNAVHGIGDNNTRKRTRPGRLPANLFQVVDGQGRALLHRLSQFGRSGAVLRLLEEGADPDVPDYSGKTALHWAAQYNHWETVSVLLKKGAAVNARCLEGRTPLSYTTFREGGVSRSWVVLSEHGATI